MYCTRKVNDDYTWVGADGRRLAMFEGVFDVPNGISFNSYLLRDEKTVLFDTADAAVRRTFRENLLHALEGGRWTAWWYTTWSRITRRSWRSWCCASRRCRSIAAPWPRP
mgnify:CR=1 FL=1